MLAALRFPPRNAEEWLRWSFNNNDAVAQIRQAIIDQKKITLPVYQIDPIDFNDIDNWLDNNQQAHSDFAGVLGIQTSDLEHTDFKDPNQLVSWCFLNFQELQAACDVLKIGP